MTRRPDSPNQCNAADWSPRITGHKCILEKHVRSVSHLCECGWVWTEPAPPKMEVVKNAY